MSMPKVGFPTVKCPSKFPFESVFASDIHIPFHDKWLVKRFLEYIRKVPPAHICLGGDIGDIMSLSRFDPDPEHTRAYNFQQEIDAIVAFLTAVRDAAPKARIDYTFGNHEVRLSKWLWTVAGKKLYGMRGLELPDLLKLDELDIHAYDFKSGFVLNGLAYTHGSYVQKHAGLSARKLSDELCLPVICGHDHTQGYCPRTTARGLLGAWTAGHMQDEKQATWLRNIGNWQPGWANIFHSAPEYFTVNHTSLLLHKGYRILTDTHYELARQRRKP